MKGGYYSVEISPNVHVISVDTLFYNADDQTNDETMKQEELDWLKGLFANATEADTFILMSHIYETASDGWLNWSEDTWQSQYYQLLLDNRDKILIEITGHDHLADFRVHSAEWLYD